MIFVGTGPMYLGSYNETTGAITALQAIGCANRSLKLKSDRKTEKVKESCTTSRLTLLEYQTELNVSMEIEIEDFNRTTLALALYGTDSAVTGATVASEPYPAAAIGDVYHTVHPDISAVTISGKVLGTDYIIASAKHGAIKWLTAPTAGTVAYTYASGGNIAAFTQSAVIKSLVFDGKSSADNSTARVTVPRWSLSPTDEFNWAGTDRAVLKLTGEILYAQAFSDLSALNGPFLRIDALA